jgi:putative transposase
MLRSQYSADAGRVWHITQRCHKQQFLLRSEVDRRRWMYWLYQARKLYGLHVLNYVVTSNHVHLLVHDAGRFCLHASMRLINQRTTLEYRRRYKRREPLWNTDFQITAIQTKDHLLRCMVYMDMNMIRAREVEHPSQWRCSGYYESLYPNKRGRRIDQLSLRKLMQCQTNETLQGIRDAMIHRKLRAADSAREPYWSQSIAVGDLAFALKMKRAFAFTHPGSRARRENGCFAVR